MTENFGAGNFARITGRVQGVNYRNSTKRKADQLGLGGWVCNTADGAVELLVSGEQDAVEDLLSWCHRGPKRAEVTAVESRPASAEELDTLPETGFEVRY